MKPVNWNLIVDCNTRATIDFVEKNLTLRGLKQSLTDSEARREVNKLEKRGSQKSRQLCRKALRRRQVQLS